MSALYKSIVVSVLALTVAGGVQAFQGETALYEAAKKDGELTWYDAHHNSEQAAALCAGFEEKYSGVKCNFIRQTAQVVFQRYAQDRQAGLKVADVVSSTDVGHYARMKDDGWLMKYVPKSKDLIIKAFQDYSDPDGYWWVTSAGLVIINYNTDLVTEAEAPKKWTDLLDPKWKDKVAIGHPGFSGYVGTWTVLMRKMYGWDYFEKLEKNNPQIGRSINDTVTMLNAKERQVGAGPETTTLKSKDKGNPLGVIYPEDGALLMIAPSGIPTNAPHPNAAKLFMEYLMSEEAARVNVKERGISLRPEVKPLPGARGLDQVKTVRPSFKEITEGIPEVKEEFRDTFGI